MTSKSRGQDTGLGDFDQLLLAELPPFSFDAAFASKSPLLALTTLQTESDQSDQKVIANLLRGVFGTFRNVAAHAPRIHWSVERDEALDAPPILSFLHCRLDTAIVVPPT